MPRAGVEPAPLAGQDPKSCVAASYTTSARPFILANPMIANPRPPLQRPRGRRFFGFFRFPLLTHPLFSMVPRLERFMHSVDPTPASAVASTTPWYRTLTRYHWFVLLVAALGWLFDCLDQQLFVL